MAVAFVACLKFPSTPCVSILRVVLLSSACSSNVKNRRSSCHSAVCSWPSVWTGSRYSEEIFGSQLHCAAKKQQSARQSRPQARFAAKAMADAEGGVNKVRCGTETIVMEFLEGRISWQQICKLSCCMVHCCYSSLLVTFALNITASLCYICA